MTFGGCGSVLFVRCRRLVSSCSFYPFQLLFCFHIFFTSQIHYWSVALIPPNVWLEGAIYDFDLSRNVARFPVENLPFIFEGIRQGHSGFNPFQCP